MHRIPLWHIIEEKTKECRLRLLFSMDAKNYAPGAKRYVRPSVRGIIIRGGTIAMVHSRKYNYYKFPGGGIESGESYLEALCREVREEAGLQVKKETIKEYGIVPRMEKGRRGETFVQDNFYYTCETEQESLPQDLDAYEQEEGFFLEFVDPRQAIIINRFADHGPKNKNMLEREARVLEILLNEGWFSEKNRRPEATASIY